MSQHFRCSAQHEKDLDSNPASATCVFGMFRIIMYLKFIVYTHTHTHTHTHSRRRMFKIIFFWTYDQFCQWNSWNKPSFWTDFCSFIIYQIFTYTCISNLFSRSISMLIYTDLIMGNWYYVAHGLQLSHTEIFQEFGGHILGSTLPLVL